jgi:hypothetical protein
MRHRPAAITSAPRTKVIDLNNEGKRCGRIQENRRMGCCEALWHEIQSEYFMENFK